jgi:uncharacterized membrane protein YbaN (DUF454 family)
MASNDGNPDLRREPVLAGPARVRRAALLATGWTCVGLGTLGLFLPVLPTTCFLLGAGACFAKSSPRAHYWLHHNRWFGRYLRDYREARVIPGRVKAVSLVVLWSTILATVIVVANPWVRAGVLGIALVITAHVATTASRRIAPAADRLSPDPAAGA